MLASLLSRLVALLLGLWSLSVLAGLVEGRIAGEPGLRTVARGLLALGLASGIRRAWTWPAGRAQRYRQRLLRLLGVLASPERQRDWAESTPGVPAAEALWHDWNGLAARLDQEALRGAFDELERAELRALVEELRELGRGLPDWEDLAGNVEAEQRFLEEDPTWRRLSQRASSTCERFAERAGRAAPDSA